MTKILAIGDFHGKISNKVLSKIKHESPDLILSPGDFCGNKELAKLYFKHAYGKSEDEIPDNIRKRLAILDSKAAKAGDNVIRKLKSLNIPILAIRGNWDPAPFGHDLVSDFDTQSVKKFEKLQSKNLKFVDLKILNFVNFVLIGGASSTAPIRPKVHLKNRLMKKWGMKKMDAENYVNQLNKNWSFRQRKYEQLFRLAKQSNKKIIFLTHNCPYNTKLDKLKYGPQKGEHYGSYQEREIIKKYQPNIVLCGHIHENFGKDKIGKSVIYNSGSASDGKFITLNV